MFLGWLGEGPTTGAEETEQDWVVVWTERLSNYDDHYHIDGKSGS